MEFILYHKNKIKQIKYQHKVWFFLQIFVLEGIISCMIYVINLFMKKVFIWLKTNILKHKKRLIYGALALFIGQICFFNLWWWGVNNSVYAQTPDTPTQNADFQKKATTWLKDLTFFQRAFYVLLYPIIALAWILVNNSFVYAEVFKFDAVLWQLWNVVRNLANYALGFLFVFKIFQFLTNGQKSSDISNLLKSTLIAWIWIQASWFLLAVLIDVSNIVAYGVGGLPIQTLKQQDWADFGNPYVFKTVVYVDTNTPDSVEFYLTTPWTGNKKFISECRTFSYLYDSGYQELILAPKMVYYYDWYEYKGTEETVCHIWDDVYYFGGLYSEIEWQRCSGSWCKDDQNKYNDSLVNAIKSLESAGKTQVSGLIRLAEVLEIWDAHSGLTNLKIKYMTGDQVWLDVDNKWKGESYWLPRLNDILSWSYVWVFTALYSSLLNAWTDLRVAEISDSWIYTSLLNVILSLAHTIAIWIPLVAMLVVFIMRIGVIWMAIILSPVIVLFTAFKLWDKDWLKDIDVLKYLKPGNLIGIIFSPAIICFAVSISTVLVRIISAVNMQKVMTKEVDILGWLIHLDIGWFWLNLWRLACCAIWVAISWFLIWSAVKASELWKSELVSWKNWLKGLAESVLWSVPVIPIPKKWGWVDFVWASTVFWWNGQQWIISKLSSNLKEKYEWENNKAVEAFFKSEEELANDASKSQLSAYKEKLTGSDIGSDWITSTVRIWEKKNEAKTFWNFNGAEQESIIESINALGKDRLNKIPENHVVTLNWGKKYKFVRQRQKKDGNGVLQVDSVTNQPIMEDVYQYEPVKSN